MAALKLVTRNIRINGVHHKASELSEAEIHKLIQQRLDELQQDFPKLENKKDSRNATA